LLASLSCTRRQAWLSDFLYHAGNAGPQMGTCEMGITDNLRSRFLLLDRCCPFADSQTRLIKPMCACDDTFIFSIIGVGAWYQLTFAWRRTWIPVRSTHAAQASRCADASACRASQRAVCTGSVRCGEPSNTRWSLAVSQRPGGAKQSAHRGGGLGTPRAGAARAAHHAAGAGSPHPVRGKPHTSAGCGSAAAPLCA